MGTPPTSRGDMARTHRDDLDRFMSEYHQRSIIEAVFGAIKKMYGNHLRGRKLARQKREAAIRIICYNIEVVARSHVKSGRLTHESLTAITS
ncbi:MAG: transposase [Cenarchaeum sp. SB0663_bin_5]|nr:transposase [Cenarchaeum sp. SB0663_bin_5]MYH04662.1 transposase [Cenarchaeum sp. SB0675_bin_21]